VVENVNFIQNKNIKDLSFKIKSDCKKNCFSRPDLASFIKDTRLTQKSTETSSELQLAIIFNIPSNTDEGEYRGTLRFYDGKKAISHPFKIQLSVHSGSATVIPKGLLTPSSDRIVQDLDAGIDYIKYAAEIVLTENAVLTDIESLLLSIGGLFEGELSALGIYQIKFPDAHTPEILDGLIEQLRNNPSVEEASRIVLINSRQFTPSDFMSNWNEDSPEIGHHAQALMYSRFLSAWNLAYENVNPENAAKIKVGIIDSGFDFDHVDLLPNINKSLSSRFSFFGNHGTGVAGVVGAVANNNEKTAGTLWNVDLILRNAGFLSGANVLNRTMFSSAIGEMKFSIDNGVKIINFSNGRNTPDNSNAALKYIDSNSRKMFQRLLSYCDSVSGNCAKDVLFTFAVDNEDKSESGITLDLKNDVPSYLSLTHPNVISVGAVTMGPDSQRLGLGGNIDIAAPGAVWTTMPGNKWSEAIGTSFATPMVAGLGGLILEL
ncbi:MAG: S8 family serine peptidase, partial [Sediminibacterium sp.]